MVSIKKRRIESPTSILTYLQCPRRYYYKYIRQLEEKPNIHLIRGGIAHSAIEAFHNTKITTLDLKGFLEKLQCRMLEQFRENWEASRKELARVSLSPEEKLFYYDETEAMLKNFYYDYTTKLLAHKYQHNLSLPEAFEGLKPKTEIKLTSEKYGVTGRIDAIHEINGETFLIDYKTSNKSEIDYNCKIQLAIYALLHQEKYGIMPSNAGIHFLRHGEKTIPTTTGLINLGKVTCQKIQKLTQPDTIDKYPRKISPLCKYATGQCDYYEQCFKNT
jgi:ATP-dependent helicase/DNAse subunit B